MWDNDGYCSELGGGVVKYVLKLMIILKILRVILIKVSIGVKMKKIKIIVLVLGHYIKQNKISLII